MIRAYALALAVSCALLVLCAGLVAGLINLRTDLSFVFPSDAPPDIELLADRLQRGPATSLVLLGLSGAAPKELISLSSRLADAFEKSGRFRFVTNGRIRPPGPELASLFDKRYLLNPPLAVEDFSVAALRRSLKESLDAFGTASGALHKRFFPADPTGRLRQIARSWMGGAGPVSRGGVWLSSDETIALMMVQSAAPAFDLAAQEEVLEFMRDRFDGLKGKKKVRMDLAGPSVFATASGRMIRSDMRVLSLASVLFVVALLYTVFRSLPLLLALVLPLGFGICAGATAVQGVYGEVHGITLAFGGTLIGVAVDYPIHLICHRAEWDEAQASVGRIWHTLRLGMLTTVVAFLPFTLSSFPGLAQIGLFAIVGLATAALFTRYLLPALLPPIPLRQQLGIWERLRSAMGQRGRLSLLALALAAAGYIGSRNATIWETDLHNLSPTPAAARTLDRRLRAEIGAADVRHLLVLRRESMEEVLRTSETLVEDLQTLIEAGKVTGFDMAARYLPSLHKQRQTRQDLPERTTLRAALQEATAGLPFQPGLFEPFLDGVERSKSGPPVTLSDFEAAGLGWRLAPLLFQKGEVWVGLIAPIGVNDPQALQKFVDEQNDTGLSYLDLKLGSERIVADYRREALKWLVLGAMIGLTTLFLGLRSVARVVRVIVPVCLSILLTIAVLLLTGTSLSLFHVFSLLLVGGVGLDYALFFERYAADPQGWRPTLRANVFCAATSVTVFTILAMSRIPLLQGIGLTVAVGTAVSLLSAFVFAETTGKSDRCIDR